MKCTVNPFQYDSYPQGIYCLPPFFNLVSGISLMSLLKGKETRNLDQMIGIEVIAQNV